MSATSDAPPGFKTGQQLLEEQRERDGKGPTPGPTAIAPSSAVGVVEGDVWKPAEPWSAKWRELVLDLVDKDRKATPEAIALFFARAHKLDLDPLAGQIHLLWLRGRPQYYLGIHAIRLLAERTHERGDEKTVEVTREGKQVKAVTVAVIRLRRIKTDAGEQTIASQYSATATIDEFKPATSSEGSSWSRMPEIMLEKCAAALAYRKAFPEVLGDAYTREELEQAA